MTTEMKRRLVMLGFAGGLGLFGSGLACSDNGVADTGDGQQACTPGESSECACSDGSTSMQVCNDNGTYDPCECGGETGDSNGETGDGATGDGDGDTGDGDGDTGDGDGDTGDGDGDTGDGDGDGDGEPVGQAPVADIFHPGDGEVRPVDVPIPFIGDANDAEDGPLSGMSVVWTSDLDGQIGTGLMFDAPLTTVGMHTITMTATDSDNQQGTDMITLMIE